MGAAPLPRRAGQDRADRVDQAAVRIRGHQLHSGQATGDQGAQERHPARAVLAAGDIDPEAGREPLEPPRRDAQQVAGRHHADQRLLGPGTALEQPLRDVRAGPQLRDRQLHRAGPRVPRPRPIAVPRVRPPLAGLPAPRRTARRLRRPSSAARTGPPSPGACRDSPRRGSPPGRRTTADCLQRSSC